MNYESIADLPYAPSESDLKHPEYHEPHFVSCEVCSAVHVQGEDCPNYGFGEYHAQTEPSFEWDLENFAARNSDMLNGGN
jgi:hypothetical protein